MQIGPMELLPDSKHLAIAIDRRWVRYVLAVAVGLPTLAFFGWVGMWGLVFGIGGLLNDPDVFSFSLFLVSSLGSIGIVGGWLRILRPHGRMSRALRRVTVLMLGCGVLASVCLAIGVLWGEARPLSLAMAGAWGLVAVVGLVLMHGTPLVGESEAICAVSEEQQ